MSNYFRWNEVIANIKPGCVKHPGVICYQGLGEMTLSSASVWLTLFCPLHLGHSGHTSHNPAAIKPLDDWHNYSCTWANTATGNSLTLNHTHAHTHTYLETQWRSDGCARHIECRLWPDIVNTWELHLIKAAIPFQNWAPWIQLLLSYIWQNSSISFPFIPAAHCWQWWAWNNFTLASRRGGIHNNIYLKCKLRLTPQAHRKYFFLYSTYCLVAANTSPVPFWFAFCCIRC